MGLPPPPPGLPPPPRKKVPPPGQPGEVVLLDPVAPPTTTTAATVTTTTTVAAPSVPAPAPTPVVVPNATPAPTTTTNNNAATSPTTAAVAPKPATNTTIPASTTNNNTTTTTTTKPASTTTSPPPSTTAKPLSTPTPTTTTTTNNAVKNSPFGPSIGSNNNTSSVNKPLAATTTTAKPTTTTTTISKPVEDKKLLEPAKPPATATTTTPTTTTATAANAAAPSPSATPTPAASLSLSLSPSPASSPDPFSGLHAEERAGRGAVAGAERDGVLWLFVAWQAQQQRAADRGRAVEARRHNLELLEAEARSQIATQEAVASSSLFATIIAVSSITAPFLSKLSSIQQQQQQQQALMMAVQQQQQQQIASAAASSSPTNSNSNNNNKTPNKNNANATSNKSGVVLPVDFVNFLKQSLLDEYGACFAEHGFDDVESLLNITSDDLVEMNCFSVGERRKILTRLGVGNNNNAISPVRDGGHNQQQQQPSLSSASPPSAISSYHVTSKSLQTFFSASPGTRRNMNFGNSGNSSGGGTSDAAGEVLAQIVDVLREDDQLLQRDWTNLRCRPPTAASAPTPSSYGNDEDSKWEARWKAACRADLLSEAQWEREAKNVIQRLLSSAGNDLRNNNTNFILSSLPRAPIAHRSEAGGLVLLNDNNNNNLTVSLPQRQKLIQRRWLGLPCP